MKVVRWYGTKNIKIEEAPIPECREDEVLIKVKWCGICGSDLNEYMHGPIAITEDTHPLTNKKAPIVLGHEFSGEIVKIGNEVTSVKVGEKVTVEPLIKCNECAACKTGQYNVCEKRGFYGLNEDGAFAKYVVVHENYVYRLPGDMTFEQGALVEPTAVAFHAVRQSKLTLGDSCAIFGAGPIGLLTIQACKAAGASVIIAIEPVDERLDLAIKMGATHTINPNKEDVSSKMQEITNNNGVNLSFDAAGVQQSVEDAIQNVTVSGQVLIVSSFAKPILFNPNLLLRKECNIQPAIGYRNIFPEVISLIASGKILVDPIITNKISLEHIVEKGFKKLVDDKSAIKVLVEP